MGSTEAMEFLLDKMKNTKTNEGNTTFTVTLGDFNNDGNLDMVTGNAHYNQVYRKYSQQGNVVKETPEIWITYLFIMEMGKESLRKYKH